MEREEKQTVERKEEWDIEELMPNGEEWNCDMSFTDLPIINRFHKTLDDAKKAIKELKAAHPDRKYRIYHWITTTTTNWVGEEEWIDENGEKTK